MEIVNVSNYLLRKDNDKIVNSRDIGREYDFSSSFILYLRRERARKEGKH